MTRANRVGAAALSGLLATIGLLFSPLAASVPPIVFPYVPIDLRWMALPVALAGAQLVGEQVRWPGPATATLTLGVPLAAAVNLSTSQVLFYLGVGWARPGMEIDLVAFASSLGVVAIGLWIALDAARERFADEMLARGLDRVSLTGTLAAAGRTGREAIAIGGLAAAGLALTVRLAAGLGGTSVPVPEIAAIGLALAAGALLLGLPRLRDG